MQNWSRSVMIMISAVIALSHHSLFGNWNLLWNASINTKQNERNTKWSLSLCPSCFPQDAALMVWKCRTPTASINQLNSAKNAFSFSQRHRSNGERLCFTLNYSIRLTRPQQRQIFTVVYLLTAHRADKMRAKTTIQLDTNNQQSTL